MVPDMTLREALKEFHQSNPGVIDSAKIDIEAKGFFVCHDIAHVIFDCDTSVQGEGTVKLWTLFGTTLGVLDHFKGYQEVNAFELAQNYSVKQTFLGGLKVLSLLPSVIIRSRQMKKKWPWSCFDKYLDISVTAIREEFNITPITQQ